MGQQPPGLTTTEPFAPGLVSTPGYEYGATFASDINTFHFIRGEGGAASHQFIAFEQDETGWRQTVLGARLGQPFAAPDGETLYLGLRAMTRTGSGWSDVEVLGPPFSEFEIMRLTASASGTRVFDEIGSAAGDGLVRLSRQVNGAYEAPTPLPAEINTGTVNAHPFLAPDDSFILWDRRRESGNGGSDIYVSFCTDQGGWSPAVNLGEAVNTDAWEASASVTPDGRFLMFHRMVGAREEDSLPDVDIYWVDARVLDALRPE